MTATKGTAQRAGWITGLDAAAARMLLDWLGRAHGVFPALEAAAAMRQAMDRALASPATPTRDTAGLEGMTQGILSALGAKTGKKLHAQA